ncbi:MAG: DUF814 domain-containing protein [Blastocatellia bacterium]|nr:DUF814 domain-containing protein [Blastocatellia bacterium]
MNLAELSAIEREIDAALRGRLFGAIFQLSKFEIAIDFRADQGRYLFISIEPANPRIYLIRRRLRDLERASGTPIAFSMTLRKVLSGSNLIKVERLPDERVILMTFEGRNEIGEHAKHHLAVQLTGRSANIFQLDSEKTIETSARPSSGDGQEPGNLYSPPQRSQPAEHTDEKLPLHPSEDLSAYLDQQDLERKEQKQFDALAASARSSIRSETVRRDKLLVKLRADLTNHGDAEVWKKYGDLLLAATSTARREGSTIIVTDYYDENVPELAIEADENDSISEAAEKYFRKYTKARNAAEEISKRLEQIELELKGLAEKRYEVESAIEERDAQALETLSPAGKRSATKLDRREKKSPFSGAARTFTSSEGFEILVGKRSKDNDVLTFRIAKSLDTWMHAADYPGSHVVIRNPSRTDIPHQTLLEAAQLAAFYSQAKMQPKAAVHYTLKKFVNKPKAAAPGLVSLSSHKTLMVEPGVPESVVMQEPPRQK